ncbi:Hla Class Ii Histocompatibility Antigen, Dr Beta 5 Chain [Manis pentadactyla]|nr:Hla Class Ii Histocompatibility Antigen, Dr Beta 5 Chain [Manis pentadactyla]
MHFNCNGCVQMNPLNACEDQVRRQERHHSRGDQSCLTGVAHQGKLMCGHHLSSPLPTSGDTAVKFWGQRKLLCCFPRFLGKDKRDASYSLRRTSGLLHQGTLCLSEDGAYMTPDRCEKHSRNVSRPP